MVPGLTTWKKVWSKLILCLCLNPQTTHLAFRHCSVPSGLSLFLKSHLPVLMLVPGGIGMSVHVLVLIKCQFHALTCRVFARNDYVNTLPTDQSHDFSVYSLQEPGLEFGAFQGKNRELFTKYQKSCHHRPPQDMWPVGPTFPRNLLKLGGNVKEGERRNILESLRRSTKLSRVPGLGEPCVCLLNFFNVTSVKVDNTS
jgi:hypothetical protein